MKTILVGLDFTKSSENTINYAIEVAKLTGSKILLFHVLTAPVVHTTSGLIFMDGNEFMKDAEKKMEALHKKMTIQYPKIKFNIELTYIGIKERVEKLVSKNKISIVILGLETKSKISQFLNGTTSLSLAGKIKCPIITVSEKYKQHALRKMIIAIDNKESISSGLSKRINTLVKYLKINVEYVHVKTESELELGNKNKHSFKVTNVKAQNFQEGLSQHAKKTKADMILLISNNYNAFHNLFIESHSKKMILASNIPVLSIHK